MSIPGNLDIYKGPSSPWSYGSWKCSWISNYLCNQCLSPLMLWAPISIRARCTILGDKACQWPSSKLQIYICMGDKEHRKYWQEWKLNKVSMVCDISNLQKILDILHEQLSPRSYHWLTPWEISHGGSPTLSYFVSFLYKHYWQKGGETNSEICLSWTLNKPKSCINRTLNKVLMQEIFANLTCINRTPVYSKLTRLSQWGLV
jgi:hypothetical protein